MSAMRRVSKELADIQSAPSAYFNVNVSETNLLHWEVVIKLDREPYNHTVYTISIDFPQEYPFKSPTMQFLTPIYHPNVDEKGQVCLSMTRDNWKPSTKAVDMIDALLQLIHEPDLEHPLREELAIEFAKDRETFNKKARGDSESTDHLMDWE